MQRYNVLQYYFGGHDYTHLEHFVLPFTILTLTHSHFSKKALDLLKFEKHIALPLR